jgi:hypothetical protein
VKRPFVAFLVAAAVLLSAFRAARAPAWNFDVLGYVSAALSWSGASAKAVHSEAYRTLEAGLPAEAFEALTSASEYRQALHANPDYLATQVPFYANKPGYVAVLWVLSRAGLALPRATQVVSIGAYLGLAALIFAWVKRRSSRTEDVWLALAFLLAPSAWSYAGYATPDLLSALIITGAMFAALELARHRLAVALLLVACAVRPDNAIFAVLLLGWLAWRGDREGKEARRAALAGLGLVPLSAFMTQRLTGAYPWGTLLEHTFVERLFVPEKMAETISVSDYLQALWRGLTFRDTPEFPFAPLFALLAAFSWWRLGREGTPEAARSRQILGIAAASVVLHYVGFPLLADRFFVAQYWIVAEVALLSRHPAAEQAALERA